MEKRTQFHIWYAIAAFMGLMLIQNWWHTARTTEVIPYSDFQHYLDEGRLARIVVTENYVRGRFTAPIDGREFVTTRVDPAVAKSQAHGVNFGCPGEHLPVELLSWIVPVLFFFALYMFFFRRIIEKQGLGGMMNVGKPRPRSMSRRIPASPSTTSPASTRPRTSCTRSSRS